MDGTGTTTYTYKSPGQLGAGQVATIDGPLSNDTIVYTYDVLGRATDRAINSVSRAVTYDALGRVTDETNPLGSFAFTYVDETRRLDTVTYPNDQTSTYSYFGTTNDSRLQTILHQRPDTSTISRFDYTYNTAGQITTWTQQTDSNAATKYVLGYDPAEQLTSAVKQTTATPPTVLERFAYTYDPAGNRTSEQIDEALTGATYNAANQLVTHQASGSLRFGGSLNEAGTVSVAAHPMAVAADHTFSGAAPVASGTNTVTVSATDASGNTATQDFEVDVTGGTGTFTYDANGNLTSDGTRSFTWDAENRLLSVTVGTYVSEFTYDGVSRRVRIVEKVGGSTTSDKRFVWCELDICEERDSSGAVTKQFFALGVKDGSTSYFYSRDHLGSVCELTDAMAAVTVRYDYDPWGRRIKVSGSVDADFGFTGHYQHAQSGLTLALYRAYDPNLARWISEDPVALAGGSLNLFSYVSNGPISWLDLLGLWDVKPGVPMETLKPPMPAIEAPVDDAFQEVADRDGVVTATTNGQHNKGSLHSKGLAVDLRGKDLNDDQGKRVRNGLKKTLGPDYDVVWETFPKNPDNNHIHVEYDPKTKPKPPHEEVCR